MLLRLSNGAPGVFRPLLQQNRDLLNDLPAVDASVIRRWAESKYGASVFLIVVPQTFGGFLNFNPHLHMLVSAGGLRDPKGAAFPDYILRKARTNVS